MDTPPTKLFDVMIESSLFVFADVVSKPLNVLFDNTHPFAFMVIAVHVHPLTIHRTALKVSVPLIVHSVNVVVVSEVNDDASENTHPISLHPSVLTVNPLDCEKTQLTNIDALVFARKLPHVRAVTRDPFMTHAEIPVLMLTAKQLVRYKIALALEAVDILLILHPLKLICITAEQFILLTFDVVFVTDIKVLAV